VDQKGSSGAPAVALGVSPYTYNLTAYYENRGLSLRASYIYNEGQVAAASNQNGICLPNIASTTCPGGAYLFNNAYAQLDLSSSLRLAEIFGDLPSDPEITLDIQNLAEGKLRSYFQYPQASNNYYATGTTYMFGIRGSF
jgi:hypothetical protein